MARANLVIGLTFMVALMLGSLPMPDWAALWRPAWVALVLIYWCMASPERAGVAVGWVVGLVMDVMQGTLLGQHAIAFSLIAFVSCRWHQQIRVLPLWQQGVTVFALLLVSQIFVLWINEIKGFSTDTWVAYWSTPLASMVLWPWVFVVLRDVRRKYVTA
ncbi:MAG: rod shape-determining protein MreD [Gammaproteobacteria bacterium]|nr:rod shape-determining protein MreD [Gammaproteobacteria bacterium]